MTVTKMPKNRKDLLKTQPPTLSDMREFSAAMVAMVNEFAKSFRREVFDEIPQVTIAKFADAETGNFAAVFLRLAKRLMKKLSRRYSDDRIEALVADVAGRVDARNKRRFYQQMETAVGVDVKKLIAREGLSETIRAYSLETAQWVKKLRDETLEAFVANSLRVMTLGGTLADVLTEFRQVADKRKHHARMVARTQVATFNGLLTKVRAQNLGIERAVWVTSADERVRPSHKERDGKEFELSEGLYSSKDGKHLIPGTDYNCRCVAYLVMPEEDN